MQDKNPWDTRQWTAPEFAADMTFKNYVDNVDPALEAVFNFKEEEPIVDRIKALVTKGEMESAMKMVKEHVQDPKYRYNNNFESQLNSYGYELVSQNAHQDATEIFLLNTELYPASANVWDSLAESYWRTGNKEKAIKYYNKAIEIDPKGRIGDNARSMLNE